MSDVGRIIDVGNSNFDVIIKEKLFFVDKTLFIKEFIENSKQVAVILRPRRFGKTTNLTMLKSFLSYGALPESFKEFAIYQHTQFVETHCGKYPVIFLSLKDCKADSWEETSSELWDSICEMVNRHREDLKEELLEQKRKGVDYSSADPPLNKRLVRKSLKWLINTLYGKYKQRVIVLIDEYDAVINHAFRNDFYSDASSFFVNFYSSGLKDNPALMKACLIGIVEVRGGGFLSGMNNFRVFSVADEKFSQFFGFTEDDIREMAYPDLEQVMEHYNGYNFGSHKLINPWSFINWYDDREKDKKQTFESYWVDTANIEVFHVVFSKNVKIVFESCIKFAYDKSYKHVITAFKKSVDYSTKDWNEESIWNFLILSGYLTYEKDSVNDKKGHAYIPNEELREHWIAEMKNIMKEAFTPVFLDSLQDSLNALDVQSLEKIMKKMILHPSFHDTSSENSYHMYFFGIFLTMIHDGVKVIVYSNKEEGHGRYDVRIEFRSTKKAIIFEFKRSSNERNLDHDAEEGLKQIFSENYLANIPFGYDCLAIGVAFYVKKMSSFKWKRVFVESESTELKSTEKDSKTARIR